jgi:hypothetical protein
MTSSLPDVKNPQLAYWCPTSGNQFNFGGFCPHCGDTLEPISEVASSLSRTAGDPGVVVGAAPDKFAGERAATGKDEGTATSREANGRQISEARQDCGSVEADPQIPQVSSVKAQRATTLSGNSLPLESLAKVTDEGQTGWNQQQINDIARTMQRIAAGANHYSEAELVGAVIRAERGELRR